MLEPTHRWTFPAPHEPRPEVLAAAQARGLSSRLAGLLAQRGCRSVAALDAFLGPPERALHSPGLLPDAAVVADRVARARATGERVMVFGDFDADGLTGLAVLSRALQWLGLTVVPYVPSRVDEGHGLSSAAVTRAAQEGCALIITVDTGSSSVREVAEAAGHDIDVIVTDHHHCPDESPAAHALVNPRRPGSSYPEPGLTGAGVAFKVAQLLLADEPGGPDFALDLADLAAVGTVADVGALVGENRAIVRLGLARLGSDSPRPALAALLPGASRGSTGPGADTLAFGLAPRINAAGRVGSADLAADLLLCDDPARAAELAAALERANVSRRELTTAALDEAREVARLGSELPAVVVAGSWPVGVIGLVAGRLASEFDRPAIVCSTAVDPWRISARSGDTFDLADAFQVLAGDLVRHGGHRQAAGGEVMPEHFPAFRSGILELAARIGPRDPHPELRLDLDLAAGEIDYRLYHELRALAPTGTGNPEPVLAVRGATVTRVRPAAGGHTQLTISKGREVLDAIAFGRADLSDRVQAGDRLDLAATLASRVFGGYESLQLGVLDAASSGWFAVRTA